ncbi:hypothetical protein BGZ95_003430, partial [Linnemannia exigua]
LPVLYAVVRQQNLLRRGCALKRKSLQPPLLPLRGAERVGDSGDPPEGIDDSGDMVVRKSSTPRVE